MSIEAPNRPDSEQVAQSESSSAALARELQAELDSRRNVGDIPPASGERTLTDDIMDMDPANRPPETVEVTPTVSLTKTVEAPKAVNGVIEGTVVARHDVLESPKVAADGVIEGTVVARQEAPAQPETAVPQPRQAEAPAVAETAAEAVPTPSAEVELYRGGAETKTAPPAIEAAPGESGRKVYTGEVLDPETPKAGPETPAEPIVIQGEAKRKVYQGEVLDPETPQPTPETPAEPIVIDGKARVISEEPIKSRGREAYDRMRERAADMAGRAGDRLRGDGHRGERIADRLDAVGDKASEFAGRTGEKIRGASARTAEALSRMESRVGNMINDRYEQFRRPGREAIFGKMEQREALTPDEILDDARNKLAALRSFNRNRLMRKVSEADLDWAEGEYKRAFNESLVDVLKAAKAEKSPEEVQQLAIDKLLTEKLSLSMAEAEASADRKSAKFAAKYRSMKKTRIAVGVLLAGAGVVGTVTGVTPLAVVALGGRALMAGVGAKMSSRAALNGAHARHVRGQASRAIRGARDAADFENSDLYRHYAAMLSAEASGNKGKKQSEVIGQLQGFERELVSQELKANGGENIAGVMGARLLQGLEADREQLARDRRGNAKRAIGSVVIGMAAAAGTAVLGHARMHTGGGHSGAAASRTVPGAHHGRIDEIMNRPDGGAAREAVPKPTAESLFRPDYTVKPGDNMWDISKNYLQRYDGGWNKLTPQQQLLKTDRLKDLILNAHNGNSLIQPGQHLRISYNFFKEAAAYRQ